MVNDGHGGFTRCTDREQVIAYGDSRDARLTSPLKTDKPDKGGKMRGGTVTTSMLVSHLPKSMCEEILDYYPRLNENGHPLIDKATSEPMTRSRWVARDRVEARRYFEDVIEYLGENVLPGGKDAIHGYDIQFSESTPHVQILADPYGADPKSTSDEKICVLMPRARGSRIEMCVMRRVSRFLTGQAARLSRRPQAASYRQGL